MLILTRRRGEAVDLLVRATGEPIATVTVLGLMGDGQVRLGFDAPDTVRILRDNAKHTERDEDNGNEESDVDGNRA